MLAKLLPSDLPYVREAIEAERRADEWYTSESIYAAAYTRQWHAVHDWAFEVFEWDDPTDWPEKSERLHRVRAALAIDVENEEVAFKKAIPVELIEDWLSMPAPDLRIGGRRRVVIRLYTWVIDRELKWAYDPEWLKIADDMSAAAARNRAIKWARGYAQQLNKGQESREIRMTQIELAWWTQRGDLKNV